MSIATGRDPQANTFLLNTPTSVHIAIPSVCYMEALSVLDADRKLRLRFQSELDIRINDAQRNLTSQHAQSLLFHLQQARDENEYLLKEVEKLLLEALKQLAIKAEMIGLNANVVQASLLQNLTPDLTDNLILNCILDHARNHATEVKVLLSGNTNDFGKQKAQAALKEVGVNHYFASTQTFLNWLVNNS